MISTTNGYPETGIEVPLDDVDIELSIVMPCLDEARTLPACLKKANAYLAESGIAGEIIVSDNGSTDGSPEIARAHGARVVFAPQRGYGAALRAGIEASRGRYIIMGDSDDSYDFSSLDPFVERLREGWDLVMGNRYAGGIRDKAMPFLHRYLGNPLLTAVGRLFFKSPVRDFYCGLRGFSCEAYERLHLRSTGMEFALEMVAKATMFGMRITEVPTILSPDGRDRRPHLRTWHDGWRSLRFYLLFSPRWLFLTPGLLAILVGLVVGLWLMPGPRSVAGITLDIHALLYCSASIILGYQAVLFSVFAKLSAIRAGLHPKRQSIQHIIGLATMEVGLIAGGLVSLAGLTGSIWGFVAWNRHEIGEGDPYLAMRIVIPSVTALILGAQTVMSSFYQGILQMVQDMGRK
jgi:glycosyltransferase involved in cell wall biosynthesis